MGDGGQEEKLKLMQLLSNDISIDILKTLHGSEWCMASNVSQNLGIHISTAQKYLTRMYEHDILQRRIRECKTRSTYEYQIKSPRIHVELDLNRLFQSSNPLPMNVYEFYFSLYYALLEGARRIGGSRFDGLVKNTLEELILTKKGNNRLLLESLGQGRDSSQALNHFDINFDATSADDSGTRRTYFELISRILHAFEEQMGRNATLGIVEVSSRELLQRNRTLLQKYGLLEDLPKQYFVIVGG
jgi:DNA-binding transcriptional ArsR family regulator